MRDGEGPLGSSRQPLGWKRQRRKGRHSGDRRWCTSPQSQGSVPLNGDAKGAGRRDAHVSATLIVLGLLIAGADTPVTLFPALTALLYRGQCHESKHSIFNPCRCCTTSL